MLISELAAKTGLTIDTIRFYEKQGLLDEQHFTRAANGYRHYSEAAVQRLTLIQQAQMAGITLGEMSQSLDEWEQGAMNAADKMDFFRRKLEQIDERIAALEQVRAYLQRKLEVIESEYDVEKAPELR